MMKELTVAAVHDNIERVTNFVNAELEEFNCPSKARIQLDVAIDELFSNIANYAYRPEVGPATVRIEVTEDPLAVLLSFIRIPRSLQRSGRSEGWVSSLSRRPWMR